MALVEVDDGELRKLQQAAQAAVNYKNKAELLDAIGGHKDTRMGVLKAIKTVAPGTPIPELDHPAVAQVEELTKRLDAFQAETAKEKAEREQRERIAQVDGQIADGHSFLARKGYTPDGIKQVSDFMKARHIVDFEVAESAFRDLHPPETSVTPTYAGRHIPMVDANTSEELRNVFMSPDPRTADSRLNKWTSSEVGRALAEFRHNRR